MDPENADAYFQRGGIYRKNGDFKKAVLDYSASIQIVPNNPMAYNNRAFCYYYLGDYNNSLKDIQTAKSFENFDTKCVEKLEADIKRKVSKKNSLLQLK